MYDGINAVRMGLSPGRGMANLETGVREGMNDYARLKAFNEDRAWLKQQRDMQEQERQRGMKIRDAASKFAASDGTNVQPLLDLYHDMYPDQAKLDVSGDQKSGYKLTVTRPDGSSDAKPMSPDDLRHFGMHMTEAMSDPNKYFARQDSMDERRAEAQMRMQEMMQRYRLSARYGSATVNEINMIADKFGVSWPEAFEIYKSKSESPTASLMSEIDKLRANRDKLDLQMQDDPEWQKRRPSDDQLADQAYDTVRRAYSMRPAGLTDRYGPNRKGVDTNGMRTDTDSGDTGQAPSSVGLSYSGVGPAAGITPLPDATPITGGSTGTSPQIAPRQSPMPSTPSPAPVAKNDLPVTAAPSTTATKALPPQALAALRAKPGQKVKFGNGQTWSLNRNGDPVQLMDDGLDNSSQ